MELKVAIGVFCGILFYSFAKEIGQSLFPIRKKHDGWIENPDGSWMAEPKPPSKERLNLGKYIGL